MESFWRDTWIFIRFFHCICLKLVSVHNIHVISHRKIVKHSLCVSTCFQPIGVSWIYGLYELKLCQRILSLRNPSSGWRFYLISWLYHGCTLSNMCHTIYCKDIHWQLVGDLIWQLECFCAHFQWHIHIRHEAPKWPSGVLKTCIVWFKSLLSQG